MSTSAAKKLANQKNAQKSTGPKTAAGKAASSKNAMKHGHTASKENVLADPVKKSAFEVHLEKLRASVKPEGYLEECIFEGYAWDTFQADRLRADEAWAYQAWEADRECRLSYERYERFNKQRIRVEKSAERARKELGKVQQDRMAAMEVNKIIEVYGYPELSLPSTLPAYEFRRGMFQKGSPWLLASERLKLPKAPGREFGPHPHQMGVFERK